MDASGKVLGYANLIATAMMMVQVTNTSVNYNSVDREPLGVQTDAHSIRSSI